MTYKREWTSIIKGKEYDMYKVKLDNKTIRTVCIMSATFVLVFAAITVVLALILTNGGDNDGKNKAISDVRGVWIASISNIDFPTKPNLSANEMKAELESIVDNVYEAGLNTIFFQVRPSSDALYKSDIFPVSDYMSSGDHLELDALDYIIKIAKKKNIAVHAWVNPLRVAVGGTIEDLKDKNPAKSHPEWCIKYADGKLYYDCGNPDVRDMIASGVKEIVERYDVCGIVFDDYFYPYPYYETDGSGNKTIAEFKDNKTFKEYGTEFDDIGDWRRDNVNKLIKACYDTVKETDDTCYFGVAPFGIWKNGYGDETGSATKGSQSYFDIYCDTLAWVNGGYVDYIAPQLYWTAESTAASYTALTEWWAMSLTGKGVPLLISHAAYRYSEWESPSGIMTSQVNNAAMYGVYKGSVYYGYEEIVNNTFGITDELKKMYNQDVE